MKLEILGSASAGFFAVAGAWLGANGSSWSIVAMALIGALIAVLDLDPWNFRKVATLLVFNTLVGAFGGPVILVWAGVSLEGLHPAALLMLPFMLGWAAHSVITELRGAIMAMLAKRIGGTVK